MQITKKKQIEKRVHESAEKKRSKIAQIHAKIMTNVCKYEFKNLQAVDIGYVNIRVALFAIGIFGHMLPIGGSAYDFARNEIMFHTNWI